MWCQFSLLLLFIYLCICIILCILYTCTFLFSDGFHLLLCYIPIQILYFGYSRFHLSPYVYSELYTCTHTYRDICLCLWMDLWTPRVLRVFSSTQKCHELTFYWWCVWMYVDRKRAVIVFVKRKISLQIYEKLSRIV